MITIDHKNLPSTIIKHVVNYYTIELVLKDGHLAFHINSKKHIYYDVKDFMTNITENNYYNFLYKKFNMDNHFVFLDNGSHIGVFKIFVGRRSACMTVVAQIEKRNKYAENCVFYYGNLILFDKPSIKIYGENKELYHYFYQDVKNIKEDNNKNIALVFNNNSEKILVVGREKELYEKLFEESAVAKILGKDIIGEIKKYI